MLDINYIRENIDLIKKAIKDKKIDLDLDQLLTIDQKRRDLISKVDNLRQDRNEAAKNKDIERGKKVKENLVVIEKDLEKIEGDFFNLMILVPNIPLSDVPQGKDESENKVIRNWGSPSKFDFEVKDHIELGKELEIIDVDTASKVSGARFAYLKGEAAILQFALIQYTFSILTNEDILKELAAKIDPELSTKPFIPVIPPVMIRPDVYIKMARLDPAQAEERYFLPKDDIYLIGSAEHTLGPMHMDQVLDEKSLPLRYVGYSTSFRREAGSYGKDTKGILRVHQFDKIEMESFTVSDDSIKEQDLIVAIQEYLLQSLGIPYQVVMICTGDMGAPDVRQLDLESWIPSQGKYRETHTSDLMADYQARRLGTKVRRKNGKIEFVHMNDATAFAIGRTLIAILENFQQKDGSVKVPKVLIPYTGFSEIKPKK